MHFDYVSLPSVATDDRKQFNNKTRLLFLEFNDIESNERTPFSFKKILK